MFKDFAILAVLDILWVMGSGVYKPYMKSKLQPVFIALMWAVVLAGEAALLQYNDTYIYALLLGFTIYFTFNASHMSLVPEEDWNWKIMAIDVTWGTVLFGMTRYLSGLVSSLLK